MAYDPATDRWQALADAIALDPATGAWSPYPASPVAAFGDDIASHPSVGVVGGHIVALHTADPDWRPVVLDPARRTWRPAPRRRWPGTA